MNKTEVTANIVAKTGISAETCATVMNALEKVSGSVLASRIKGIQLNESGAVEEISASSGVPAEDCVKILTAFEETFGEALSDKFRFFRRK